MFEAVKVNADTEAVESERIPAFEITKDGKTTEYTIPKDISGATALQALEVFLMRGEGGCVLWLAQHALGTEGYDAVATCEQLTLTQAQTLIQRIGKHYLGRVKELGKAQE